MDAGTGIYGSEGWVPLSSRWQKLEAGSVRKRRQALTRWSPPTGWGADTPVAQFQDARAQDGRDDRRVGGDDGLGTGPGEVM